MHASLPPRAAKPHSGPPLQLRRSAAGSLRSPVPPPPAAPASLASLVCPLHRLQHPRRIASLASGSLHRRIASLAYASPDRRIARFRIALSGDPCSKFSGPVFSAPCCVQRAN